MINLALAYLRDRPLTTALNVILLALAVAMLVLIIQFGSQAGSRFERDVEGIDLVVGAKGSPSQLILSSVLHVDQPTGNIPLSSLETLRSDPAVNLAVPLALGDNFEGFRIVGTDESFAQVYELTLAQGTDFEGSMQAVLGAEVAQETGAQLGQKFVGTHGLSDDADASQEHDHAVFETVGILAPSGTVADRLILVSYESVWEVHGIGHSEHDHDEGHDHDHNHGEDQEGEEHHDHSEIAGQDADEDSAGTVLQAQSNAPEAELTALLVQYANASGAIRIPAMINRQTQLQAAVPAQETARLLNLFGASIEALRAFAWLIAATGGLAILVASLNIARTREGDLALLRVMGASRMQVCATILFEGVITAALGAVLGWFSAHAMLMVARARFPMLDDLGLQAWAPSLSELLLLPIVLMIGAIAALIPAIRVYRNDPARIIARA